MAKPASSHVNLDMPKDAPPTASSPNAVEHSPNNESGGTSGAAAPHRFCFRLRMFIFNAVLQLIILLVQFIWYLYWLLSQLMFVEEDISLPVRVAEHLNPKSGDTSVDLLNKGIDNLVNGKRAAAKWRVRILLMLLLSLLIVVSVPGLKRIKVLGLPLWKWTVMVALAIVSYHYISLLSQRIVKKLSRRMIKDNYDVVYYADGLRRSVNNVISCVFILLAWELYFRSSRHGLRRYGVSERAIDIGTWTAVSLLVFAFLLLAKNALILSWESRVIYRQFTDNIGKAGLQLYFLGLVSGKKFNIFSPRKEGEGKGAGEATDKRTGAKSDGKQGDGHEKENKDQKMTKIEKADKFISRNSKLDNASTYIIKKKMAKYFIAAARSSSRKSYGVPKEILKKWQRLKGDDPAYISKDSVMKYMDKYKTEKNVLKKKNVKDPETTINDAIDSLFEILRKEDSQKHNMNPTSPDEISSSTFEEWMTEAFKNCLSLGYTLIDAKGLADNLNNVMRAFLSIVVFLCWLLLTSIISTKALITIASPFIAATFIFGDTLKAVFEGIIFIFVTHPFIVGDLCIIDDTQLEVRQMDVLKTTFHKINSEDEVLYPNKILAEKAIFNLKGNLDGRDCIELSLDKSVDINSLESEITTFFEKNKDKFKKDYEMMTMEEIGETLKIAINFNHIMKFQDYTHGQCFKKKKNQRSDLLKAVFKQVQTKESSSAENMSNSSGSET